MSENELIIPVAETMRTRLLVATSSYIAREMLNGRSRADALEFARETLTTSLMSVVDQIMEIADGIAEQVIADTNRLDGRACPDCGDLVPYRGTGRPSRCPSCAVKRSRDADRARKRS